MKSLSRPGSHPSLLIVEDDKVICEMIVKVIERKYRELSIYCAENGQIGVDLFKEHRPDIVITDINMPVMDGIEMAVKIKAIQADVHLIVMTAYSDKAYFEKFSKIGFCAYLMKPIILPALFAAIDKCFEEIRGSSYIAPPSHPENELLNSSF